MAQEIKGAVREANSSVRGAVSDMQSSIGDAGAEASETVKKVVRDLSKAGSRIADAGKETFDEYAERSKKQIESIEGYIQEYPIRSVLMGAAAGAVLAKLVRP